MMTSTATDSTRGGSSSLDCILKNTEFENTQQAKAIESEREKIQAYEKQLEEKLRQTRELEESTVSLDEQAKRLHKQFRLNRENYDSLKRTTVVLDEHEEALQRKFKATLLECEEQKAHHEQALSKYADIWTSYHTTYEGSTKAQELQKKYEELQLVDEQNANLEKQIQELNVSLASLQLECDNQGSIVTRVSQMASWRVDTEGNRRAAAASEERAELLLKQVAELEEGVARAEEVLRVQEANKLQDKQAAVMEKELNHQLGTDGMPPDLLPDVNSLSLVVSAVQPPHRLTAPTPPGPGPTPQSLMHLKPTAVQSRVANLFTLPEVPARPASNSASSEKTGTAVGTNSVRLPLAPISLPVSKQSTTNTTPADQSLGTSRYLLEIPQFSLPARSSTAARNAKASSQSESRGPVLQRQGAASTSVPSISIPARISGSHLLQMPSLQNPSRPQPSTPTLSMAREKAATQLSEPPRQPKPSFQLTVPITRAQDNIHSPRPNRPQGYTSSGAGEKLGNDSAVEDSVSNGERAVHSLPSILTESQPVPDGEDRNGSTQTAQNQESGPDEQPDQQYSMEPDQQFSMEPDQQFNMEPDQQYTMEAADQSAEVDAAAYEGYYPSGMQEYMQQYAMYGGQVLEYANNGDMMQIPQGEEADRPGTEPLEGANEFFPSANESTPGGFLYAGFGSAGAAGGFSGGFSFLSESGSQSEGGGVGGNQATLPGVSFPLFGGDSPAASTHTQGFSLSFGGGGTSAPAASGFSLF